MEGKGHSASVATVPYKTGRERLERIKAHRHHNGGTREERIGSPFPGGDLDDAFP